MYKIEVPIFETTEEAQEFFGGKEKLLRMMEAAGMVKAIKPSNVITRSDVHLAGEVFAWFANRLNSPRPANHPISLSRDELEQGKKYADLLLRRLSAEVDWDD